MMMPTGTGSESRTRIGFAVANLGSSWSEYGYGYSVVYWPYVKEMSMKIQGDGAYGADPGYIYDNAGTASSPTEFVAILNWLENELVGYGIMGLLKDLYTNPPSREWQAGGDWIQAIDRQQTTYVPSYGTVILGNRTQTATAFLSSYLYAHGYRTITITAQAQIYVEGDWTVVDPNNPWKPICYSGHYPVDTYSVGFQVTPLADEPPNPPGSSPVGPDTGYRGPLCPYSYLVSGTDTEFDQIRYKVFWGDGTSTETDLVNSGQGMSISHWWSNPSTYHIYFKIQDSFGLWSDPSPEKLVDIVNRPPNPPDQPRGLSQIYAGISYYYSTYGSDPDLDIVYVQFNWGDGQTSSWIGPTYGYLAESHIWNTAGTYSVTAQAKDTYGLIGNPSSPCTVTVYDSRYMRGDTQQINGLSAYKLDVPQSDSPASSVKTGSGLGAYFGIRAWIRHPNGVEQEISLDGQTGAPRAIVEGGLGAIRSNTVSVAQTTLQFTDSLVIRVYTEIAEGPWYLDATFTTEQLQSSTLKATTWTVYYYTYARYYPQIDRSTAIFYWGTATYNSRIQNIQYSYLS